MSDQVQQPLSDLVTAMPAAMQVFNKYDLDFCCDGKQTLWEACREKGLIPENILNEIESASIPKDSFPLHVQEWSTGFLIDFIIQNYHSYVRDSIPMLQELLEKVCAVHAMEYPFLLSVQIEFEELASELLTHMKKEEFVLFPALREREDDEAHDSWANIIQQPIQAMEDEHQMAGDYLKFIRSLTNNYIPPADACPTFAMLYRKLAEFDQELINQIHLENNVLFKRV